MPCTTVGGCKHSAEPGAYDLAIRAILVSLGVVFNRCNAAFRLLLAISNVCLILASGHIALLEDMPAAGAAAECDGRT
ncbi:MAG: hypothetical protein JHD35_12440 [Sphingopyxis sp.]|nr:hypothetical protein [Sphingopyxis sp.]